MLFAFGPYVPTCRMVAAAVLCTAWLDLLVTYNRKMTDSSCCTPSCAIVSIRGTGQSVGWVP